MTSLRVSALLLALSLTGAAQASTITYNLTGAGTSAGTLSGTVAVDSTTARVTAANLTLNDTALGSPTFNTVGSTSAYNGISQDYILGSSSGPQNYGGQVALFFGTAGLGTDQLSLCTVATNCGFQGTQRSFVEIYSTDGTVLFHLTGGTLSTASASPTTVTPEPSSLVLLGTAMLGMAGMLLVWPSASLRSLHLGRITPVD